MQFYCWVAEIARVVVKVVKEVLVIIALAGVGKILEKEAKICPQNFTKTIEFVKYLKSRWWLLTNPNKAC